MKSSPMCEPAPNSKKCLKCYRDHRVCSWAADVSGTPLSLGSPDSGSLRIEDDWSDVSDIELEDEDEEVHHHHEKSAHMSFGSWYKEINGKVAPIPYWFLLIIYVLSSACDARHLVITPSANDQTILLI